MAYYKFLTENYKASNTGFSYADYLPKDGQPGEWLPAIEGELEMCANGYHATDAMHLLTWANKHLYEVECEDVQTDADVPDKVVCRRMRLVRKIDAWNDKTARLFACWCVRQVWILLEDERSRNAVEVAERYANGEATEQELYAAWNAACSAACSAAWYAARDAAIYAARAAAWAAACASAWANVIAAARDAACASANDTAWAAAWANASAAAEAAQSKHLVEMLGLEVK